jgi:hypothetical protein
MSKTTILMRSACAGIAAIVISVLVCILAAIIAVFATAPPLKGTRFVIVDVVPNLKSPEAWGIAIVIFAAGFFWQFRKHSR